MSAPRPLETELLQPIEEVLSSRCAKFGQGDFESRLQLLEATSSRVGGFDLEKYFEAFNIKPVRPIVELSEGGGALASLLSGLPMHPALAISALAREPLQRASQRTSGAYHTDFRLAQYIAALSGLSSHTGLTVLDPACGAGILLAAVGIAVAGADRQKAANWISNYVYASDRSELALRGTRLSLASLTNDIEALRSMWGHFRCQDSLLASDSDWEAMSPSGFDLIVGNPPWEKVKLTRHEFLQAQGHDRHYGAGYGEFDKTEFYNQKESVSEYASILFSRYDRIGPGEVDLYKAFLQLCSKLIRPGGRVALLVPAGLIRSKGTGALREDLIRQSTEFSLSIIENRARFFEIDTRFKFLALTFVRINPSAKTRQNPIHLLHVRGTEDGVEVFGDASIGRRALRSVRADYSVPEVLNTNEWKLFVKMAANGEDWSKESSPWFPDFLREVDMTSERSKFLQVESSTSLPVIEGRMIQPHRFGAKHYVSGTGRKAVWGRSPLGFSHVLPQFWIDPQSLKARASERSFRMRVGFCDITGQTNERSMMATMVPPGTVCGNKVPTVIFPNDDSENRQYAWLAIVNSLPFDWLLRRVITTTVNFFLLVGTRLPSIEPKSIAGRRLTAIATELAEIDRSGMKYDPWAVANLRVQADLLVALGYGLKFADLAVMFRDFPLLDRGQPSILDEPASTITRDFLLLRAAKQFHLSDETRSTLDGRVRNARKKGAIPYVSAEFASTTTDSNVHTMGNAS